MARLAEQVAVPLVALPAVTTGTAAHSSVAPSLKVTVAPATSPGVASVAPGAAELSSTANLRVAGACAAPAAPVTSVSPV